MFKDLIKPALEEAKKYIKTDEFKNSDKSSQDSLIDAIGKMEKSLGGAGGLNFKRLGQDMQTYQNSLNALNNARSEEIDAINKLKKAQEEYEEAVKSGTEQEKQAAKETLDSAQSNADAASSNVKTQTDITNQSQQGLSSTATNLKANMDNVTDGLSKLASGGLKNAYDGLIKAGKSMGGAIGKIADSLESVPIVGWILSIIDILKDGLSNLVGSLLDSVFNAVSGVISDVFSGDLFVTLIKSIVSGVGNILNSLSFGGFNSLFGLGGPNELSDNVIKTYEVFMSVLDKLIKKQEELIRSSSGIEAVENTEKAIKYAQEQIDATKQLGVDYLNSGSSGGSRSHGYELKKALWAYHEDFERATGVSYDSLGGRAEGIFELSVDQLIKWRDEASLSWAQLDDDTRDYLNSIIEGTEKIDDLKEALRETNTGTSFDSLVSNFKSAISDMDKSAEDFANDFEKYMQQAVLGAFVNSADFQKKLREWYEDFDTYMQSDGLDEVESADLKSRWNEMNQEAIDYRDAAMEMFGWESGSSREASSKGFASMSQDSANELNGRFTAMQSHTFELNENMKLMVPFSKQTAEAALEIRNSMETLRSNSAAILVHLAGIEANTSHCSRLESIESNMKAVKNGINDIALKGITIKK